MGKKRVSIYIDEKLLLKAKNLGLNISRICERALTETIEKLEPDTNNHNIGAGGGLRTHAGLRHRISCPALPQEPDLKSGPFVLARAPPPRNYL